eukprot:246213-Rhodomonas_salina.3
MTLAMMQHVNPDLELGEPLLEAGHQLCIVSPICAGLDSAETQMILGAADAFPALAATSASEMVRCQCGMRCFELS